MRKYNYNFSLPKKPADASEKLGIFTNVQYISITDDDSNRRLDNFLYAFFSKNIPRNLIHGLIRTGQVRVNGSRAKSGHNLTIGNIVRIPPVKFTSNIGENNFTDLKLNNISCSTSMKFWQEKIKNAIIFENSNLLIINKPSGLAVHGGSKIRIGLLEVLRSLRSEEHFLELVHRLDKETSGCIMIAKKRSYLRKLHLLLQEHKVIKTYSALVKGMFNKKQSIQLPLKKIIKSSKEHFVKVSQEEGSYAKTICLPETCFNNKNIEFNSSLIMVKPLTGKTHQIRVHLSSIGFPIANDDKYGDREYNNNMKKLGLNRMFLHAQKLQFICPQTNQTIAVKAEYDKHLITFLSKL